jgi:SAM-dependent methyltransferase
MSECKGLPAQFQERFLLVTDPAMIRAERLAIGGDYGASSYTTIEQADELGRILRLGAKRKLLDVGSGSGWPGNYLAASTGCVAFLTDPIIEGMAVAFDRSRRDDLEAFAAVADGTALPFEDRIFDAATSSDAFC